MNILSLTIDRDGCSGYRVMNPFKAINSEDHQTYILKHTSNENIIYNSIIGSHVICFRQCHDRLFHHFYKLEGLQMNKKLSVVDFDDDMFNITPFADTYIYGGLEEVMYDGKWLWKDGQNGFDIEKNRKNLESAVLMAKQADLITVTTEHLKKRMEEITGHNRITVLPNGIDFTHWKKWDLPKGKQIRIGWSGGATHYIDLYTIKNGLKKLHKKYGDKIKFVLSGSKWEGTLKGVPYEYHDWIDFEAHPYKQASLNLDIAIIPLADTLFNKSKSCIKWYEYSALGVPSVVSNVMPYSTEIEHNKTALAFNNEKEFVEQVSRLIDSQELRHTIGSEAYDWVYKNRNIDTISHDYITAYQNALNNKYDSNS